MKIGAHESVSSGVHLAIERAIADGCEAIQLFVKSPNRWNAAQLKDAEVSAFIKDGAAFGFENITAHGAYLINLASPKEDVYQQSLTALADELGRCDTLHIPYYVLHPGSPLESGRDFGIKQVAEGIDKVYGENDFKAMLLLEITAGMGHSIGGTLDDLVEILNATHHMDSVGFCLDSCHMHAAGYDIVNNYDNVMNEVASKLGDKLKVFHLNDNKNALGSHKDRHELIGDGSIGVGAFANIVNDARFAKVLGILETPVADNYAQEIKLLKSLRKM